MTDGLSSPEFTIALIRTPFLSPRFAAFYVPLNFNKLDLRDYLDRLYGVKALKIRSVVEQQRPTRERPLGKNGYGRWRRPQSKKRMTVELAEPFVWPEEPKDLNAYVCLYMHACMHYLEWWIFVFFTCPCADLCTI